MNDEEDARRYRWLKEQLNFFLGSYDGPDSLKNATESCWDVRTVGSFTVKGCEKPSDLNLVIDVAMVDEKNG